MRTLYTLWSSLIACPSLQACLAENRRRQAWRRSSAALVVRERDRPVPWLSHLDHVLAARLACPALRLQEPPHRPLVVLRLAARLAHGGDVVLILAFSMTAGSQPAN